MGESPGTRNRRWGTTNQGWLDQSGLPEAVGRRRKGST